MSDVAATVAGDPALRRIDGKLRGGFWTGATANAITSAASVADGKWHHAVLSAGTGTQTLYLDGDPAGTGQGAGGHRRRTRTWVRQVVGVWPSHGRRPPAIPGFDRGVRVLQDAAVGRSGSDAFTASKSATATSAGAALAKKVVVTDPGNATTTYLFDVDNGNRQVAEIWSDGGQPDRPPTVTRTGICGRRRTEREHHDQRVRRSG